MLSEYNKILLGKALDELEEISFLILKDEELYNKLLNKLTTALVNSYEIKRRDAIKEAIEYLVSLDKEKFSKENIKKINSILKKNLSKDLASILESSILNLNEAIFILGLKNISESVNFKLSFNVADKFAADVLGKHNLFWVQTYYEDHLQESINDILIDYFTSNKTLSDVAKEFESAFNKKTEKGIDYFEGLAEHTTNRVRELGKITGYEKAGLEYYQIKAIIDERTSDICLSMHERIFPVAEAIKFKDDIIKLKSPEDIKKFAPWRKPNEVQGVATENLPPGMELPPYHWRCRTITVAYFGDPSK